MATSSKRLEASLPLPFDQETVESAESRIEARDRAGRERAVDPRYNTALEASAGTGKTRVLVDRYINLLKHGVDPSNILAITFTRKAAAEMRERIIATLRHAGTRGEITPGRWRELRDRTADISISTIDAFCLSLLREFPLEADLDPGFAVADETEVPRLVDEALDRALRTCRALAREDEHVALVFAQLGDRRVRHGLAALLNRRVVAPGLLQRFLTSARHGLTLATAAHDGARGLLDVFAAMRGGLERFIDTGPPDATFWLLASALRTLDAALATDSIVEPLAVQAAFARAREHFLTLDGKPRSRLTHAKSDFSSSVDWEVHRDAVLANAAALRDAYTRYRRDLNALVSRGVWRMFRIAEHEYRKTLDAHVVLDFADTLMRALDLLRQMEEFAQSRYRLESRYHHVLVDEFQDTSRAQWELVALLVQSWGEGAGLAHTGPLRPSVFIVGDKKQSIYGFRDADVSLFRTAADHLETLRSDGGVRRSISRSFRAVPSLLRFVNDLCADIEKASARPDAFDYDEQDRFPVADAGVAGERLPLGVVVGESADACAAAAAGEIARLMRERTTVRDRDTGVPRPIRFGDIAILFRTRESHREFEMALEQHGIPAYVYKGLGFFDADEIKDVLSLLWYLADPLSDLRAAAWLRSRFVDLSDEGLRQLAPALADTLMSPDLPEAVSSLDNHDRTRLLAAREGAGRWRALVDRLPPAELLDVILTESAYAAQMRGPRFQQARENIKKIRALIRRIQNRGYATLGRIAAHLDRLAVGDEANAVLDATDAVNLMTVHAAKGLEFPVVFLVNLSRGTGGRRDPIRIGGTRDAVSVAVGDFQSEADEDETAREREETKRLLYVACTRARDRLYLGTLLQDGRVSPGRGSLADVLPVSLLQQLAVAPHVPTVDWRASSGVVHVLTVCSPDGGDGLAPRAGTTAVFADADFAPVQDVELPRQSIAAAIIGQQSSRSARGTIADSDRLTGRMVHRLLQRFGASGAVDEAELSAGAIRALREERVEEGDRRIAARACALYRNLTGQPDLRQLYQSGRAFHEIPFSLRIGGEILRGAVDCLIHGTDGSMTVLEFKTGRPRPEHEQQAELYRHAIAEMFPGVAVGVRLIYPEFSKEPEGPGGSLTIT